MKKLFLFYTFILMISCGQKSKETVNIRASAQRSDELEENPLLMNPITSSIQPNDSTMSTLYGNEIAFDYAKHHSDSNYPEGTILYEVTWKQKPDELWFGANIPKEIFCVEKISFRGNDYVYQKFEGNPLKKNSVARADRDLRQSFILSQKMAVSP